MPDETLVTIKRLYGLFVCLAMDPLKILRNDKALGAGQIPQAPGGGEARTRRGRNATSLIFHTKCLEEVGLTTY